MTRTILDMVCHLRRGTARWMRRRHRVPIETIQPSQPGFTVYQCIQLYWLNEQGITQKVLAQNLDCNQSTISRAIRRGRDSFHEWDVPRMLVVGSDTACGHNRPIQVGERVVCLRCFVSGYDEVHAMRVTAADLAELERKAFEATLPKDKYGEPIYPKQEPLKPFAERKHGRAK